MRWMWEWKLRVYFNDGNTPIPLLAPFWFPSADKQGADVKAAVTTRAVTTAAAVINKEAVTTRAAVTVAVTVTAGFNLL